MKANTIMALKKIIKETVEKEVAKQMQLVIKEITAPAVDNIPEMVIEDNLPTYMQEPADEKQLAKDPVLNKILNETQGGIPADAANEYPTMGGKPYTTDNTHQLGMGSQAQMQDPNMPDFMKKAMSGHSAKVVKAIGKKHGTKTK
tara:strand:+ start:48 stop:482 length:435 start_codon:yes stop_codon:yes gene_type:complete